MINTVIQLKVYETQLLFERYLCKFNIYKKLSQETIKKIGRKIITFNAMISNQNQRKIHSITSKQINNLNK